MLLRVYRMRISCSHCGELNEAGTVLCGNCGHCADRPRMACVCRQCVGPASDALRPFAGQGREPEGGGNKV